MPLRFWLPPTPPVERPYHSPGLPPALQLEPRRLNLTELDTYAQELSRAVGIADGRYRIYRALQADETIQPPPLSWEDVERLLPQQRIGVSVLVDEPRPSDDSPRQVNRFELSLGDG